MSTTNPLGNYARAATSAFDDEANGIVVGGIRAVGRLYYDNRPQGPQMSCDTEEELREQAQHCFARLKAEHSGYPCYLYADDSKWELRLFSYANEPKAKPPLTSESSIVAPP